MTSADGAKVLLVIGDDPAFAAKELLELRGGVLAGKAKQDDVG